VCSNLIKYALNSVRRGKEGKREGRKEGRKGGREGGREEKRDGGKNKV